MVRVEAALPDVADALPEALVLAEPEAAAEPEAPEAEEAADPEPTVDTEAAPAAEETTGTEEEIPAQKQKAMAIDPEQQYSVGGEMSDSELDDFGCVL